MVSVYVSMIKLEEMKWYFSSRVELNEFQSHFRISVQWINNFEKIVLFLDVLQFKFVLDSKYYTGEFKEENYFKNINQNFALGSRNLCFYEYSYTANNTFKKQNTYLMGTALPFFFYCNRHLNELSESKYLFLLCCYRIFFL